MKTLSNAIAAGLIAAGGLSSPPAGAEPAAQPPATTQSFAQASVNVAAILGSLQKPLGEIITAILGNDELQKRFESDPDFQKRGFGGKSSGQIALDLKIVDPQTKDALLIAQAAARMVENASRIVTVIQSDEYSTPGNLLPVQAESFLVKLTDERFKYVGSERDSAALKNAQAGWQVSQLTLNLAVNKLLTPQNQNRDYAAVIPASYDDNKVVAALKWTAAEHVEQAARILADKGFAQAATRLLAVAGATKPAQDPGLTPAQILDNAEGSYYMNVVRPMAQAAGFDAVAGQGNAFIPEKLGQILYKPHPGVAASQTSPGLKR